ncbi:hypothetical protein J6P92_04295 [bacterium]|nr:hypothetical protein [bacterium]
MNGILSNQNNSDNKLHGVLCPKSSESVETAGSLAMGGFQSLFAADCYDEFSSSNPFSVDYSLYSDCGDCVAYGGFLSDFSNAVSTISGDCGASFSGGGDCGSCSCGGFTSMC